MTARATELRTLAELVADAIALHEQERRTGEVASYRPEIRDPAMAAAFDAAMERYGCGVRAWRKGDAPAVRQAGHVYDGMSPICAGAPRCPTCTAVELLSRGARP